MADLAGLAGIPGIDLTFLDTFSLLDSAIADPGAFGLTNVSNPCYVGPYTGGGSVCSTPGQYLSWDQVHPTATGHGIVAQAALRALPEPGTLAIVAIGLALLAASVRCEQWATPSSRGPHFGGAFRFVRMDASFVVAARLTHSVRASLSGRQWEISLRALYAHYAESSIMHSNVA